LGEPFFIRPKKVLFSNLTTLLEQPKDFVQYNPDLIAIPKTLIFFISTGPLFHRKNLTLRPIEKVKIFALGIRYSRVMIMNPAR